MKPLFFILAIGLAGCSHQKSDPPESEETVAEPAAAEEKTIEISTEKPVTCLDIETLEKLELGGEISILGKKGYTYVASEYGDHFTEITYKNRDSENVVKVHTSAGIQGDRTFIVEYHCQPEQINCFIASLVHKGVYSYQRKAGFYRKSGLGSYRSKTVTIDDEKSIITYKHNIGQELVPPKPIDSLKIP